MEVKQIPEDAQLISTRIRTFTGFSTCTKVHRQEGHIDHEGQNPDLQQPLCPTGLPLVLDVEDILVIYLTSLLM